jgi:hypothetical protein
MHASVVVADDGEVLSAVDSRAVLKLGVGQEASVLVLVSACVRAATAGAG